MSLLKIKKLANLSRAQRGMASIVVVSVLTVLLTLIAFGFARLMNRAAHDSQARQASTTATYAAQSAINDVATYLVKVDPDLHSSNCTNLIGTSSQPGPFYNDANLSGTSDPTRTAQYSCLLVNQTPPDIQYTNMPAQKSRVVRITTDATPGKLDKLLFSWQASDPTVISAGTPTNLTNVTSYDSTKCSGKPCIPMLRVTLYPVPIGGATANIQNTSKTYFLYPHNTNSSVPGGSVIDYTNTTTQKDGSIIQVACDPFGNTGQTLGANFKSYKTTGQYQCSAVIKNLSKSALPASVDYLYARITPLYGQVDLDIQADDTTPKQVNFSGVQALVDATAKVANVAKRLQARIDTSLMSNGISSGIDPNANEIPEYGVRTANTLCKRWLSVQAKNPLYSFIQTDAPSYCLTGGFIPPPTPTLILSVNGVDSQTNTPAAQSFYKGVSYIGAGGAAALHWHSNHAYYCPASGNWGGDKYVSGSGGGVVTYNTPTKEDADGNQAFAGIANVQTYNLQCFGAAGPTPALTVRAWPPPRVAINVDASSSPDGKVHAGRDFVLTWTSWNAINCNLSSTASPAINAGMGGYMNWSGLEPSDTYGAQTTSSAHHQKVNWDYQGTVTFTVVCHDPINRASNTATIKYVFNHNVTGGCTDPNACGGTGQGQPPYCIAQMGKAPYGPYPSVEVSYQWFAYCPDVMAVSPSTLIKFSLTGNVPGATGTFWMPQTNVGGNKSEAACISLNSASIQSQRFGGSGSVGYNYSYATGCSNPTILSSYNGYNIDYWLQIKILGIGTWIEDPNTPNNTYPVVSHHIDYPSVSIGSFGLGYIHNYQGNGDTPCGSHEPDPHALSTCETFNVTQAPSYLSPNGSFTSPIDRCDESVSTSTTLTDGITGTPIAYYSGSLNETLRWPQAIWDVTIGSSYVRVYNSIGWDPGLVNPGDTANVSVSGTCYGLGGKSAPFGGSNSLTL